MHQKRLGGRNSLPSDIPLAPRKSFDILALYKSDYYYYIIIRATVLYRHSKKHQKLLVQTVLTWDHQSLCIFELLGAIQMYYYYFLCPSTQFPGT